MARLMRYAIKTDASGALASAGVLEALPQEEGIIGGLATRRIVEGAPHFGARGEPGKLVSETSDVFSSIGGMVNLWRAVEAVVRRPGQPPGAAARNARRVGCRAGNLEAGQQGFNLVGEPGHTCPWQELRQGPLHGDKPSSVRNLLRRLHSEAEILQYGPSPAR